MLGQRQFCHMEDTGKAEPGGMAMPGDRSREPKITVPKELSSFIGREREMAVARRLLSKERLVTLTGAPGVGKTRLGARVAGQVRHRFPDGVWWIDLASLHARHLLAETLVEELGAPARSGGWAVEVLSGYLRNKRMLLVLDNSEHAIDDCAVLIREVLRRAPGLRVLVTSRYTLGVDGEAMLTVYPMSIPPVPTRDRNMAVERVGRFDALQLFCERAREFIPGFCLDERNCEDVVRICQRLDGIPLALELAAVQLGSLSVRKLADRLDERFTLLTKPGIAAFQQHKLSHNETLRAAIDWSFDSCSDAEQTLWMRASVFRGYFDSEAAQEVCAVDGIEPAQVPGLLRSLARKSILVTAERTSGTGYRMLETITVYGRDRLAERGEELRFRQRHRDFYHSFCLLASERWMSPHQLEWFARVREQHGNLRAALELCVATPEDVASAVEMLIAVRYYWVAAGALGEGRRWLDLALALCRDPGIARVRALWADSHLALLQSDLAAALPELSECQALADRVGDTSARAYVQQFSGVSALVQGDYARAVELLEAALVYHRRGNRGDLWLTLFYSTLSSGLQHDTDRAEQFAKECLELCERTSARLSGSYALWTLGLVRWWQGQIESAHGLVQRSLRDKKAWNDNWGIAYCLEVLSWIAAARAQPKRAATLLGAADALFRSSGTSAAKIGHLSVWHETSEDRATQELGEEAFSESFRHGGALDRADAIAFGLDNS